MIIDSIVASGIQELYRYFFELYDHGKTPMEKKYKDEKRSTQLLNTVTVYLELADLTSMEYFVLKRYLPKSVFFFDSQFVDEQSDRPRRRLQKRIDRSTKIPLPGPVSLCGRTYRGLLIKSYQ